MNQFVIMFTFGSVEAMIGPHLKKYGAMDSDVGLTFLLLGFMAIFSNIVVAKVSVEYCNQVLFFDHK